MNKLTVGLCASSARPAAYRLTTLGTPEAAHGGRWCHITGAHRHSPGDDPMAVPVGTFGMWPPIPTHGERRADQRDGQPGKKSTTSITC